MGSGSWHKEAPSWAWVRAETNKNNETEPALANLLETATVMELQGFILTSLVTHQCPFIWWVGV